MGIARSGQVHRTAAWFSFGREEVIPLMFLRLVARLAHVALERWSTLHFYLMRHIDHGVDRTVG